MQKKRSRKDKPPSAAPPNCPNEGGQRATPKNPELLRGYKLRGRLPDGARFAVAYDADAERWTGTLTIGDKVFAGEQGALFKLLEKLDQLYRASLEMQKV
jgi:hypothetical protein